MASAIDQLRGHLHQVLRDRDAWQRPLGRPEPMQKVLRKFEIELGAVAGGKPRQDRVQKALLEFLRHGTGSMTKSNVRYLCWGLSSTFPQVDPPLVERPAAFERLIEGLQGRIQQGALSFTAWRGLVICYFSLNGAIASSATSTAFVQLRTFLKKSLRPMLATRRQSPRWLEILNKNQELLGDSPCVEYAEEWLDGTDDRVEELRSELQIPDDSWFWDAWVEAIVRAAASEQDGWFKGRIPRLLQLLGVQSERVRDRALPVVLERYARCKDRSIHKELLDFAIPKRVWGSPRVLNSPRWGLVRSETRKMVAGWMHERNLKDFFDLLSKDKSTDQARLEFWMRYLDRIDDSYMVLGADARDLSKAANRDLYERHKDTMCELRDGLKGNNAFIMKLGDHVAVEFGMKGNACFLYAESDLPFDLGERQRYYTSALKNDSMPDSHRQVHQAGWQAELEAVLRRRGITVGSIKPKKIAIAQEFSESGFNDFIKRNGLEHCVEDNRRKHGWLWVRYGKATGDIADQLRIWGFEYKGSEKGWGR